MAEVFQTVELRELSSYLIEITAGSSPRSTPRPASRWSTSSSTRPGRRAPGAGQSKSALDLGIPVTGIAEAVFARALSSSRAQRTARPRGLAAGTLARPRRCRGLHRRHQAAPHASKVVAYARGFDQIAAGAEYGWNVDRGALATIWRGGCIIRAQFLNPSGTHTTEPRPALAPAGPFTSATPSGRASTHGGGRRHHRGHDGHPTPAFASSLAYYDGLRTPPRQRRPDPGPARLLRRTPTGASTPGDSAPCGRRPLRSHRLVHFHREPA